MKMKISRKRLQQLVVEEFQNLTEEGILAEAMGDIYKEGDRVVDDRNGDSGVVVAPMAGGAVIKLDDGREVKFRAKFLSKAEEDPQESLDLDSIEKLVREEIATELNSIFEARSSRS